MYIYGLKKSKPKIVSATDIKHNLEQSATDLVATAADDK